MAQLESQPRTKLTSAQRAEVFDKTFEKVSSEYFDPKFNGTDWPNHARAARDEIVAHEDPEAFESAMHLLVRKLGTSHTGFVHQSARRIPARLAIAATFRRAETNSGPAWMAQDVHTGGPADVAGLKPLDRVVAIDDRPVSEREAPMFPMGSEQVLRVLRGSNELLLRVSIPNPKSRKQPSAQPDPVTWKILSDGVGYLKVAILPGVLGLDVARQIDRAIAELDACERLILDLRGHVGGGLGVLRLMSHLTPHKIPIGYTITRKRTEKGYEKENLPRLDRLPTHLPNPLAIASMAVRFVGRDPSVVLVSEGLGSKRWHGNVAMLVNEHTISAGEMVAAFATENGLAKVVGTETAGRLIPGSGFKVGYGYMLVMPKAEYVTWGGQRFEGAGVKPNVMVAWEPSESPGNSHDTQLQAVIGPSNDGR
jgi:C-terminal processing protease CtpA/Prc